MWFELDWLYRGRLRFLNNFSKDKDSTSFKIHGCENYKSQKKIEKRALLIKKKHKKKNKINNKKSKKKKKKRIQKNKKRKKILVKKRE